MYYLIAVDFSGGTPALTHSVHCGKTSHCLRTDFFSGPYGQRSTFYFSVEHNHPVTLVKRDKPRRYFAFSEFRYGTQGSQAPPKALSTSISLEVRVSLGVWSLTLTGQGLSRLLSWGTLRELSLSVKRANQALPPIRLSPWYPSMRSSPSMANWTFGFVWFRS
jgi:hypothetical protein